jgi:hypothetical protein
MLSCELVSVGHESIVAAGEAMAYTSQNSRMNCLHMPQGLAGGLISVATAIALMSPFLAP